MNSSYSGRASLRLLTIGILGFLALGTRTGLAQPNPRPETPIPGSNPVPAQPVSVDIYRQPPWLYNVSATPPSLFIGQSATLTFSYRRGAAAITTLHYSQSNTLGSISRSIPAEVVAITAPQGTKTLVIDSGELALGSNSITLQLEDALGRRSPLRTVSIAVVGGGGGGTAPEIVTMEVASPTWNRPSGEHDEVLIPVSIVASDPDGDFARVRVRRIWPDLTESLVEVSNTEMRLGAFGGITETPLFQFRSSDPLGIYSLELTPIDFAGNVGTPQSHELTLTDTGGVAPPRIVNFVPATAGAGSEVVASGEGFDAQLENNAVSVAFVRAEVIEATPTSLRFIVPAGAVSGPLRIATPLGRARSDDSLNVPSSVLLEPQVPSVVVGGTLAFSATTSGAADDTVIWSVSGIPGGNATVGTIVGGAYSAPSEIPGGVIISVRAALAAAPTIFAETSVTLLPPPSIEGSTLILAARGGEAVSSDNAAGITIPPGAISANTTIGVTMLRGQQEPAPEPGRRILSAVQFVPDGLAFSAPASIRLPLNRYYPPGSSLSVKYFLPANGTYVDEGIVAIVDASGSSAVAAISHFSTVVIDAEDCPAVIPPFTIDVIQPTAIQEATTIPVRIRGVGLTPCLVPVAYRGTPSSNGQRTWEVEIVGPVYGIHDANSGQDEIGFLVHVVLDRELDGFPRPPETFSIGLVRPGQPDAAAAERVAITVDWLPDFPAIGGDIHVRISNTPITRVSSAIITANQTIFVDSGTFVIESTGPIRIESSGSIDASGQDGGHASHRNPGTAGRSPDADYQLQNGGAGGVGRLDPGCFLHTGETDCSEPENFGDPSNVGIPGFGGRNGYNWNLLENVLSIALRVFECVSGEYSACFRIIGAVSEFVNSTNERDFDGTGKGGGGGHLWLFPHRGLHHGSGGGGGGGGGCVSFCGCTDPCDRHSGGGGGGGGAGGRAIKLISGTEIFVDGGLRTDGGDGGNGASYSISSSFNLTTVDSALPGGGGGGGAGGELALLSPVVRYGPNQRASIRGGIGGRSGAFALTHESQSLEFTMGPGRGISGTAGRQYFPQSFYPQSFRNCVTNRTQLDDLLISSGTQNPIPISVTREDSSVAFFTAIYDPQILAHRVDLTLGRGFNTIRFATPERDLASDLLDLHVLVLEPDADGDGLSDLRESELLTNPNDRDTDNDGLDDLTEVLIGSNPLQVDSDVDGASDGSDPYPTSIDGDGDGASDGLEILLGTNPTSNIDPPTELPDGMIVAGGFGLFAVDLVTGRIGLITRPSLLTPEPAWRNNGEGPELFATIPLPTQLVRANGLSGTVTNIGDTIIPVARLSYRSADDAFYGAEGSFSGPSGQLLRIDPLTGTGTLVGSPLPNNERITAVACAQNGDLYALLRDANEAQRLVTLDPLNNTVASVVGPVSGDSIRGLAFSGSDLIATSFNCSGQDCVTDFSLLSLNDASRSPLGTIPRYALGGISVKGGNPPPPPGPNLVEIGRYSVGSQPRWVRAADLTGDGFDDVVTANFAADTLSFLRNLGDHTFAPAVSISAGDGPIMFDVGSLRDVVPPLRMDIAVALANSATITLLLNDGNGVFTPSSISLPAKAKSLTICDLNGDALNDLAAVLENRTIRILWGDGTGGFSGNSTIAIPTTFNPRHIRASFSASNFLHDFNGDLNLDLLVNTEVGEVFTYHGNGAGVFTLGASRGGFAEGIFSGGYAEAAKLNQGFAPEIVLPDYAFARFHVFYNNNAGQFPTSASVELVDLTPWRVLATDFQGDEQSDLITSGYCPSSCTGGALYFYASDPAGSGAVALTADSPMLGVVGLNFAVMDVADFGGSGSPFFRGDLVTNVYESNEVVVLQKQ